MEAVPTKGERGKQQGNDACLEDISPYENLRQPQPPAADLASLADVELGCFLRNTSRFQAIVQSHKTKIQEEVCPVLAAVLSGTDAPLSPASAMSLFEASRTARDSWQDASAAIYWLFEHKPLPPFFERYCDEVRGATFSLMKLLQQAQKKEGADWRREVEESLALSQSAARASELEVDVYLSWLVSEGKREVCERHSLEHALNI